MALTAAAGIYQEGLGGGDFLFVAAFAVVPYLFGRAVGASRTDSERQALRADRAVREREAARAQAVADERLRIARELHDVISHSVSLMGVQAGAARKVLPAGLDDVEAMLRSIEGAGRDTLDEMRRLLGVMREGTAGEGERAPQPGIAALDELVARTRAAGVPVALEIDDRIGVLSPGRRPRRVPDRPGVADQRAPPRPGGGGAGAGGPPRRPPRDRGLERPAAGRRRPRPSPATGSWACGERAALYDGTFSAGVEAGRFVVRAALPVEPARAAGLTTVER